MSDREDRFAYTKPGELQIDTTGATGNPLIDPEDLKLKSAADAALSIVNRLKGKK